MSKHETTAGQPSLKEKFAGALHRACKGASSFMRFEVKSTPQSTEQVAAAEEAAREAFQERLDAAYKLGETGPQGYIATAVGKYGTAEEKLALLKGCAANYSHGRTFPVDTFALFHPAYKTTTEENPMFQAGYKGSAATVAALVKIDTLDLGDKAALIIGAARARKEKQPGNMEALAKACAEANTMTLADAGEEGSREVLEALIQHDMSVSKAAKIVAGALKAQAQLKHEPLQNFLSVYIQSASEKVGLISGQGAQARLSDAYRNNVITYAMPLIEKSAGPTSSTGLWSQKMDKAQKQIFVTAVLLSACEKGKEKIVEAALLHKADGMAGNGLAVRIAKDNPAVLKALYDGGVDIVAAAGAQGLAKKAMEDHAAAFEKENLKAQVEMYKKQAREMTQKYLDLRKQVEKNPEAPSAPAAS